MNKYIVVGLSVLLVACNSLFIEEDPSNSFEENFEVFWQSFDRHYAYFDVKDLDWQAAYDTNIHRVRNLTTNEQLFLLLENLTLAFQDGHVNLYRLNTQVAHDFQAGYPLNDPENAVNYLSSVENPNTAIQYGEIADTNLGYIRIFTFGAPNNHYEQIDMAIATLADKDGIIIDVRNNGGGSDINADRVATRFMDQERVYRWVRFRNGSKHSDFNEWRKSSIGPEGTTYTKPVAILTNRRCFSTAESFILSMKTRPDVWTVGGNTGGGSGNPIFRELPNGWTFRLSSWQMTDADFNYIEETGIEPDSALSIPNAVANAGIDTILEGAIALLEGN